MGSKSVMLKLFRSKCPFYYMTATWRKNVKSLKRVCKFPLFDLCPTYGVILGLLGMGISFYDIIKLVQCGELLCTCLYRGKTDKIMKPSHERDFKLINVVLSFEYYTLIVFGTVLKKPALFVPWLTLYAFIIMGDVLVFVVHLLSEGCNFDKNFLSSGILLVYNWLAVFCLFLHIKTGRY